MTAYASYNIGRLSGLKLEFGWGVHDQLMGGLVVIRDSHELRAFRLDPDWTTNDGERKYALYKEWNDYTGDVLGNPYAWCYESDIEGAND